MLSAAAYPACAECSAFYRDTELSPAIGSMYRVGVLFREPTFCDATYQFGGFAAPHRYLILSANARCVDAIYQHPEWGLCLWQPGPGLMAPDPVGSIEQPFKAFRVAIQALGKLLLSRQNPLRHLRLGGGNHERCSTMITHAHEAPPAGRSPGYVFPVAGGSAGGGATSSGFGSSPMMPFSGHKATMGHFWQPATRARGHRVMGLYQFSIGFRHSREGGNPGSR